jgi:hypothetical protein
MHYKIGRPFLDCVNIGEVVSRTSAPEKFILTYKFPVMAPVGRVGHNRENYFNVYLRNLFSRSTEPSKVT